MKQLYRALHHLPRGLLLAALIGSPLVAVQNVRASHENLIEGHHDRSNGAGFVILMSLKRAQ